MPHEKVTDSINSNETQGLTVIKKVYITSFFSFQKLLCNPQYKTRWVLLRFRRCRYARSRNSTIRDQSGKSDLEETPSSPINFHQSQQTFPLNKATRAQLKLTSSWRIAVRSRNVAIYNSTDDIKKRTIIYFINVLSRWTIPNFSRQLPCRCFWIDRFASAFHLNLKTPYNKSPTGQRLAFPVSKFLWFSLVDWSPPWATGSCYWL